MAKDAKHQRILAVFTLAALIAAGLIAAAPSASASPGDLHIFQPTIQNMNVDMEQSVTYRWGIYNNGTRPHAVLIDIVGDVNGWTATLSDDDSYFVIEPGTFHAIDLNVTAPDTRDYAYNTMALSATVRDLVTEEMWPRDLGSVNTTITGGAYIPPTKVLGWFDDPLGEYIPALDNEWGVFITTVLIWFSIALCIYFLIDPIVKQFTKRTKTELDDAILAIVKKPVFILIAIYGVVNSLEVLNFPWKVVDALNTLFTLSAIILGAWMAYKIFQDVMLYWAKDYAAKTETDLDDVLLPIMEKAGMVIIAVGTIIGILNLFGIDVTLLVAGMGVIGLVIAFAAQDTLGNFISGMFLLTDRPFKVGDLVQMDNGDYCRVEEIGMRSTKLYNTFDHDMIILPNNKIANEKVVNLNSPDSRMKVKIGVGIAYDADLEKAKRIMLEAANKHPDIIHEPEYPSVVRLIEFADSSINLKLFTWVNHLENQWRAAGDIREEIFRRFNEEGIEIPFPQRVVHMREGSAAEEAPDRHPRPEKVR